MLCQRRRRHHATEVGGVVVLGIGGNDWIVYAIEKNRPHLGAGALAPDHEMEPVESAQTHISDQKIRRDLIEFLDRRLKARREHDFVTAVSEQRHCGRLIGPHGDNKDLSHAACLCGLGVFPVSSK